MAVLGKGVKRRIMQFRQYSPHILYDIPARFIHFSPYSAR